MNKKVIDLLNQARERELGAISQYMIHHYELMLHDREMRDPERLTRRTDRLIQ
jgi:bacterioferritin (cytochrome b1)